MASLSTSFFNRKYKINKSFDIVEGFKIELVNKTKISYKKNFSTNLTFLLSLLFQLNKITILLTTFDNLPTRYLQEMLLIHAVKCIPMMELVGSSNFFVDTTWYVPKVS
jgi:hypothetical protein